MNLTTIHDAQKQVDHWIKTVGIRYFSELTNMAILTEEVGEVARLISRIYGEQSFKKTDSQFSNSEESKKALADELADVFFVLVCLANQTGINLTEAFSENLKKKSSLDKDRHKNNHKLHNS